MKIVEMKRITACIQILIVSCSLWICRNSVSSGVISDIIQQTTSVSIEEHAVFHGTKAVLPEADEPLSRSKAMLKMTGFSALP